MSLEDMVGLLYPEGPESHRGRRGGMREAACSSAKVRAGSLYRKISSSPLGCEVRAHSVHLTD